MVLPSERSVRSGHGSLDIEIGVGCRERNTTQSSIIGEVAQSLDLLDGKASGRRVFLVLWSQDIVIVWKAFVGVVRYLTQTLA